MNEMGVLYYTTLQHCGEAAVAKVVATAWARTAKLGPPKAKEEEEEQRPRRPKGQPTSSSTSRKLHVRCDNFQGASQRPAVLYQINMCMVLDSSCTMSGPFRRDEMLACKTVFFLLWPDENRANEPIILDAFMHPLKGQTHFHRVTSCLFP